ncbi:hypothetical protein JIG36_32765 [Actinoplanes sp. LDG1-06]|uniref:Uncharacterized protein n=1 Tax=Paractinoplanes ovalisporus TaxID=2810368 RepID=A0ABS2AKD0_9ACTN|nr:hypothetical protein [Actinoplanes ovalisporus]MBM2620297.1 hypothetical protein [Actinoplanes ovalisporus]
MVAPVQRAGSRRTYDMPNPYPQDPTTATRHLCAAAYLDESFRTRSLRYVYYQAKRLVAPSFGFDLVPVLSHCLRARNGALVRGAVLLLTLVTAAFISTPVCVGTLAAVVGLQVTVSTYRLVRDALRDLRAGVPIDRQTLIPRVILMSVGWGLVMVVFMLAVGQLRNTPSAYSYADGYPSTSSSETGVVFLILIVFLWPVAHAIWRQNELSRLVPGSPLRMPHRTERLDEVGRQQRGNTAVYSGYRPYVGSGPVVSTEGIALRLVRPESPLHGLHAEAGPTELQREFEQPPFQAHEIISYVRDHLTAVLPGHRAEEEIAGLSVEDRICLAGTEVGELSPDTSPEVTAAVVQHPTTPARHYLTCQVFGWGGQLVTTVYVHIAVQGRSLYLEMTTTALPPCAEQYRVVDTAEATEPVAWLQALGRSVIETPSIIARAPLTIGRAVADLVIGSGQVAGAATLSRGFDYGARYSVREMGTELVLRNGRYLEDGLRNLTQMQDVDRYRHLIERRVLAAVLDFLEDSGVDTVEYRARAASILNVTGGHNNFGGTNTYNGSVTVQAGRS